MPQAWDKGPSLDPAVLTDDTAASQLEIAALHVLLRKKRDCMHPCLSALGW